MNRTPNEKDKNGGRPSYNASGNSVRRQTQSAPIRPDPHAKRPEASIQQRPINQPYSAERRTVNANPNVDGRPVNGAQNTERKTVKGDPRVRQGALHTDQRAVQRPQQGQQSRPQNEGRQVAPPKNKQPANRKNTNKKPSVFKRMTTALTTRSEKKPTPRSQKNDFIKPTDVVRIKGSYDKLFLILVIILTLFGIIMDFSASYAYAYSKYGDSFYFVKQQIIFACIGMGLLIFAMRVDYRWLRKFTVPYFIAMTVLLIAVLVRGIASGVAQRWITIGITFQPSEFMKPALVCMLALYVARNQDRITNYRNFRQSTFYGMIIPFLIVAIPCGLIFLEKHFSGTIITFAIGAVIIFAAGAQIRWFVGAVGAVLGGLLVAIMFVPYAKERVSMLLNPESYDPTGKIWQTLQGLYAIGSGGLFGVGLGNSRQKHMYVSQPQNDFVFSIIAEELGFAGAALVIILFMLLIWRGFVIALKAPDTFSSLVVIGLISKVAIQTLLNIAVVTNLIPNTGISLPFFSYGGTALVVQLAEMGVILSISKYSYQKKDAFD